MKRDQTGAVQSDKANYPSVRRTKKISPQQFGPHNGLMKRLICNFTPEFSYNRLASRPPKRMHRAPSRLRYDSARREIRVREHSVINRWLNEVRTKLPAAESQPSSCVHRPLRAHLTCWPIWGCIGGLAHNGSYLGYDNRVLHLDMDMLNQGGYISMKIRVDVVELHLDMSGCSLPVSI